MEHEHTESCKRYRGWIDEDGWHYETWCQRKTDGIETLLARRDSPVRLDRPYS